MNIAEQSNTINELQQYWYG